MKALAKPGRGVNFREFIKALSGIDCPEDAELEIVIDANSHDCLGVLRQVSWYQDEHGKTFLRIDIDEGEVL